MGDPFWYGRLKVNVWRRLAHRRIDQIDRDVLSRLLLNIHSRAPGTSDKIAQALSRVFRFALGRGYIQVNPLEAARAALPSRGVPGPPWLGRVLIDSREQCAVRALQRRCGSLRCRS